MIFKPTTPEKIVAEQLYEARRLSIEHEAAAEHHQALATMYKARIARLEKPKRLPTEEERQASLIAFMGADGAAAVNESMAAMEKKP